MNSIQRQKKRKRISRPLVVLILITLVFFAGPLLWLGFPTVTIILGASRVQVFKVDSRFVKDGPLATQTDHHSILGVGRDLSSHDAAYLKRRVLAPLPYALGPLYTTACRVRPGVAFRLWRGQDSVDVLACYECAHIIIVSHNSDGKIINEFITPFPVGELSDLVRKAFPNDPELQGALRDYEIRSSGLRSEQAR